MTRDWHGVTPAYRRDDGARATSLFDLPGALARDGVLAAWGELDDPFATVVAGVRREPCAAIAPVAGGFLASFEAEVARIAAGARDPIVALGGGLDAAAVLVAWRASGVAMPAVATLATGLLDYDEVAEAEAIAKALDVRCEVLRVTPSELVALAPDAAIAAETPLYNLHPVHRLAVARAARATGAATLVTGDGADACFAGRPDLDYVPIVAALTGAGRLALASPFLAPAVIAATPQDPRKHLLRDYLREHLGALADRPKHVRLLPPLALPLDRARIDLLAHTLGLPLQLERDHRRVGWHTLDHVVRHLGRHA